MSQIILLDVDGVLIRNPAIQKYVTHRSVEFVRKYHPNQSYDTVKNLNTICYTKLGHSSFLVRNSKQTVVDYNEYVFDEDTLRFVRNNVTERDVERLHNVMRLVDYRRIDTGLCTNSPQVYCEELFSSLEYDIRQFDHLITSDSGFIKPMSAFFDAADVQTNEYSTIHFIDDSVLNTKAVRRRPRWNAHVVTDDDSIYRCITSICN